MAVIAKSLATLRDQVNALAPNRSKAADGWIGDAAHQATASDHNPNAAGVVTALDITHDPSHGFDSWAFAEMLRQKKDGRVKYVISNGRIFSATVSPWSWRTYTGSNKHDHHVHVSVSGSKSLYDDPKPWDIAGPWKAEDTRPTQPSRPTLKEGSRGEDVKKVQAAVGATADGIFGPKTKAAVIAFQKSKGLAPDGIVGPYTWAKIK